MNVRKPTDYSAMFAALDELMAANLPQIELYRGIGRVVNDRPEKGAAVAAAEHLKALTLTPPGSLPEACAGCGTSAALTKAPRRSWPRP